MLLRPKLILGSSAAARAERRDHLYQALLSAIPDQLVRIGLDGSIVMIKEGNDPTALTLPATWVAQPIDRSTTSGWAGALVRAAAHVAASGTEQTVDLHTSDLQVSSCPRPRYAEVRLIPETVDHVVGIVRDVTDRRQSDAQRGEASTLEALGRLSAGVAHEINTPIQFVSHNVEFMSSAFTAMHELLLAYRSALHSPESLPWAERSARLLEQERLHDVEFLLGEVPQAVEETLEGVRRVATIVHAMKQFAHPSSRELQSGDVNDAVVNAVVVSTNEHKYVADVELHLGDLPPVMSNAGQLTQVFLNLVVNAAQALEPLRELRGRPGRIVIATESDGREVVVRISDDGPGISHEDQQHIFDAFFTTKAVGQGTGQGLTLARAIVVEGHGGRLDLHSVPGEGSTFEIRLPVAGPEGAPGPHEGDGR